jgi:hypothetical protein
VAGRGARAGESSGIDRGLDAHHLAPGRIYAQLDQLNTRRQEVDTKLRRLRSDVNLSGIFVRDYLLDVARERDPEYRRQLAAFRATNMATVDELKTWLNCTAIRCSASRQSLTSTGRHSIRSSIGRPPKKFFKAPAF